MANKGALLALAAFGFATWAVYLGGIAAQQSWGCDNKDAFVGAYLTCSKFLRYDWWLISYEIVIILIAFFVAIVGRAHYNGAVLALFSIAAAIYTVQTDKQYAALTELNAADITGAPLNRQRTIVAGLIMTSVVNYLVAIVAGITDVVAVAVPAKETNTV